MEIYVEYLVLDNLSANACILAATLHAVKRLNARRVIAGSITGAVIGLIYPLLNLTVIADVLFKLTSSALIVILSNFRANFSEFLREWVLFFVFTFIFGGFFSAVLNILNFEKTSLGLTFALTLSGAILVVLGRALVRIFTTRRLMDVEVNIGGIKALARWDTGNGLTTLDGAPVHVLSPDLRIERARPTGRQIEVRTVSGDYTAELMQIDELTVISDEPCRAQKAYFVYAKHDMGAVKVILNVGLKGCQGGNDDEKLFC